MRRSDREITDEQELLQVISECDVCRLALNDEEVPYILPLNFGEEVSGGRLYNPFSTRTKRISAYRTCQINSVKLWSCQGVWRNIPFPV